MCVCVRVCACVHGHVKCTTSNDWWLRSKHLQGTGLSNPKPLQRSCDHPGVPAKRCDTFCTESSLCNMFPLDDVARGQAENPKHWGSLRFSCGMEDLTHYKYGIRRDSVCVCVPWYGRRGFALCKRRGGHVTLASVSCLCWCGVSSAGNGGNECTPPRCEICEMHSGSCALQNTWYSLQTSCCQLLTFSPRSCYQEILRWIRRLKTWQQQMLRISTNKHRSGLRRQRVLFLIHHAKAAKAEDLRDNIVRIESDFALFRFWRCRPRGTLSVWACGAIRGVMEVTHEMSWVRESGKFRLHVSTFPQP